MKRSITLVCVLVLSLLIAPATDASIRLIPSIEYPQDAVDVCPLCHSKWFRRKLHSSVVIVANSIDYELSMGFVDYLEGKGVEVIRASALDFEGYTDADTLIILGGPGKLSLYWQALTDTRPAERPWRTKNVSPFGR